MKNAKSNNRNCTICSAILYNFVKKTGCRWCHGKCNGLTGEESLEKAADASFVCLLCRPGGSQHALALEARSSLEPIEKPGANVVCTVDFCHLAVVLTTGMQI